MTAQLLLADDHTLFRELIKKHIEEIPGLAVVGEAGDGLEVLELLKTMTPDMIILDISLPKLSGIDAAFRIKESHPEIKILLLTMHKSRDHLDAALRAKVEGYVLKEDTFKDLTTAIEKILQGETYVSGLAARAMAEDLFRRKRQGVPKSQTLSGREVDVIKYFAEGKSFGEIAGMLAITPSTVRNHLNRIRKKLAIKSNIDLVKYALKEGLIV